MQKNLWKEAANITITRLGVGTAGYLLDWLTYQASHTEYHHKLAILFYWIMPVTLGFSAAWVDAAISERTSQLKFYSSLLIRSAIFVVFSLLAASAFLLIEHETLYAHARGWLILKFVMFWLPASLLVLALRNLLRHFDEKTILEWLLGTYHLPSEEDRIFLFVDIKDSTSIAESLGNKQYFDFIQEFHNLAADAIKQNEGQVYQYIGDEIVITWTLKNGVRNNNAINLFFEIEQALQQNASQFYQRFGRIATVRGALHAGRVTRGEIGKAKKEFGYVGDVINTAARMQSVAKKTPGASLVISEGLLKEFTNPLTFDAHPLGNYALRGKNEQVSLYALKPLSATVYHS